MRPMVLMLPDPAMPATSVANVSGAMIDLIRRRKIVPSRRISLAGPGNSAPKAMPATSEIRIHVVSEGFFMRYTIMTTCVESCPAGDTSRHAAPEDRRCRIPIPDLLCRIKKIYGVDQG